MSRSCVVCSSPHRDEVDSAAAGGESLRKIAVRLRFSRDGVRRHAKNHLPEHLRGATPAREVTLAAEILAEVVEVGREILQSARREGRDERALRAIDRNLKAAELLLRKAGELRSQRVNVNFGGIDPEAAVRMVVAELERRGYRVIPPAPAQQIETTAVRSDGDGEGDA